MEDPQPERDEFLEAAGEYQAILHDVCQRDDALSADLLAEMESRMGPLLVQGFFAMNRKVLSPQEYYQGCMIMLLATLSEEVGNRPKLVTDSIRDCLKMDPTSKKQDPPLLLNLVLDRSRAHPGLEMVAWEHVLGFVSTVQSNVATVNRRQRDKKNYIRSNQQCRRLLKEMPKIAKDSLDAMWVVPISYIIAFVVYDSICRQREGDKQGLSWEKDIHPKVGKALYAAFPRLRPREYIDAGITLLQLDLLQEEGGNLVEDLNTKNIAEKLQGSLLKLLVLTTDLPRYSLLAKCVEVFLKRLDLDDSDAVIDACTNLFRQESPTEYLAGLEKDMSIVASSNMDNKNNNMLQLRNGNGEYKEEARDESITLGYPLLMNIDALLADDNVEGAIDIAVRMEHCSALTDEDQLPAWGKVVGYLLQTGHIFLDGFPVRRPHYMANRALILEKIMTRAGQAGLLSLIESYEDILQRVATSPNVTDEENEYLERACHQSVLRILQAKHGDDQGIEEFQQGYCERVEATIGSSRMLLPLSVSSSKEERRQWAFDFLCQKNVVPDSLRLDDTERPDLIKLFLRGEPKPQQGLLTADSASKAPSESKTPAAVKEAIRAVVLDECSPSAGHEVVDVDVEMEGVAGEVEPEVRAPPPDYNQEEEVIEEEEDAIIALDDDDDDDDAEEEVAETKQWETEADITFDEAPVEQAANADEGDEDEVICLDDSDEEKPVDNEDGGHESDETADEGSIQELLGGSDDAEEYQEEAKVAYSDAEEYQEEDDEDDEAKVAYSDAEEYDENQQGQYSKNDEAEELGVSGDARHEDEAKVGYSDADEYQEEDEAKVAYSDADEYKEEDEAKVAYSDADEYQEEDEAKVAYSDADVENQQHLDNKEAKDEVKGLDINEDARQEDEAKVAYSDADEYQEDNEGKVAYSDVDEYDGNQQGQDLEEVKDEIQGNEQEDEVICLDDDSEEEQVEEEAAREDDGEMIETTASMDEAGSQISGYEPGRDGFTEEEVSEAMHTEDEEEERQEAQKVIKESKEERKEETTEPPRRVLEQHTLSDMDMADEHTTEHEEDLGAESSELDEGDAPPSSHARSTASAGKGTTLMAFAIRAQRQVESQDDEDEDDEDKEEPQDTSAGTTGASTPWHWSNSATDMKWDSSPSSPGPQAIKFGEKGAGADNAAETSAEVVVDDTDDVASPGVNISVPAKLQTPATANRQSSVMGASYADTSAAQFGSVSFVDSPNYPATDDEVEGSSPQKVVVDCVPNQLGTTEEKAETGGDLEAIENKPTDKKPAKENEVVVAEKEDPDFVVQDEPASEVDNSREQTRERKEEEVSEAQLAVDEEIGVAKDENSGGVTQDEPKEKDPAPMASETEPLDQTAAEENNGEEIEASNETEEVEVDAVLEGRDGDDEEAGIEKEGEMVDESVDKPHDNAEDAKMDDETEDRAIDKEVSSNSDMKDGEVENDSPIKVMEGTDAKTLETVDDEVKAVATKSPDAVMVEEHNDLDAAKDDNTKEEEEGGNEDVEDLPSAEAGGQNDGNAMEVDMPEEARAEDTAQMESEEHNKSNAESAEDDTAAAEDGTSAAQDKKDEEEIEVVEPEETNRDEAECEPEVQRESATTEDAVGEGKEDANKEGNDNSDNEAGPDEEVEVEEEIKNDDSSRNEEDPSESPLQADMTLAQLAEAADPTDPSAQPGSPNDSAGNLDVKSISIPNNMLSPALSSVAASDDGGSMRSPHNIPVASAQANENENANADGHNEEDEPKTAKKSNRRRGKKEDTTTDVRTTRKRTSSKKESVANKKAKVAIEDGSDNESTSEAEADESVTRQTVDTNEKAADADGASIASKSSKGGNLEGIALKRSDSVSDIEQEEDGEEGEKNEEEPKDTSTKPTRATRATRRTRASSPAASTSSRTSRRSTRSAQSRSKAQAAEAAEASSEDEAPKASRPTRQRRTKPAATETPARRSSRRGAKAQAEENKANDEGDDESTAASQSSRRSTRRQAKVEAAGPSDNEVDDQSVASSVRSTRRNKKRSGEEVKAPAEDDDDAGSVSSKGKTRGKRQKVVVEDDLAPIPEEAVLASPALKASAKRRTKRVKETKETATKKDETSSVDEESSTKKAPAKRATRAKRGKSSTDSVASEERPKRSTRSRRKAETTDDEESVTSMQLNEETAKTPGKSTRAKGKKGTAAKKADDSSSEEESKPPPKARATKRATRSRRGANAVDEEASVAESTIDDESIASSRASRTRGKKRGGVQPGKEEESRPSRSRTKKGKAADSTDDDESKMEEEEKPKPKKRKAVRGGKKTGESADEDEVSVAGSTASSVRRSGRTTRVRRSYKT